MTAPVPAGSIPVHRAARSYERLPPVQTIELAAPPVDDDEHEPGQAPAVLAAVLAAVSGAGFALVSGDPRYLGVCLLLAIASLATARLSRRASRRARDRTRARRHAAYLAHLDRAGAQARVAARRQREALDSRHPTAERMCAAVNGPAGGRAALLWQRHPEHVDFGTVRLGTGVATSRVGIAVHGSSQPFDPAAEPLRAAAQAVVEGATTVPGCPVLLDLRALRCVAVLGPEEAARAMLRSWVTQLVLTHPPTDLLVVVPQPARGWDWARWLPHTQAMARPGWAVRDLARAGRTVDVTAEALAALLRGWPAWSVVVADLPGRPAPVVPTDPRGDGSVTYLVVCSSDTELPAECGAVVRLRPDGSCALAYSGPDGAEYDDVLPETLDVHDARRTAIAVAPMVATATGADPPTTGTSRDPLPSAQPVALSELLAEACDLPPMVVPLGRGEGRTRVDLDLREAAAGGDGPHGVLVGATGSGKSELLRSLVLALCARRGPEDLALVLVDFKGGATFDALAALPQVAGLVTNLAGDLAGIARFQQSLEGELDERQQRLRTAGCDSMRDYRGRPGVDRPGPRRPGPADPLHLPDLLVVVDEFGELLEVQPDMLDTFGRIGRLGRSLGIHLLLSSQRLDEGRLRGLESHLAYRIALRTHTAAESMAVLGTPAAHQLPASPGVGLLRTAGGIRAFRAATTSMPEREAYDPRLREVVRLFAPWAPPAPVTQPSGGRTELTAGVAAIAAAAPARVRPVCLPALAAQLPLVELIRTYPGPGVVIGMVDHAAARRQEPLRIDLFTSGHLAAVGSGRSGRSSLLLTLAAALAAGHDPTALHLYVLDLGGSLEHLGQLPHTAALASGHDAESVRHVLEELAAIVAERAGSVMAPGGPAARSVLLVDDVGRLRRTHPDADDLLVALAVAGQGVGVHVAMTAARWSDLRPPLLDAVGTRLELHLDEPADSRWPRACAAAIPAGPGGALSPTGAPARLALAVGTEPVALHPAGRRAPTVVPLPRRIGEECATAGNGEDADPDAQGFLLGFRERRITPVRLPLLRPGSHLLLLGDSRSGRTTQLLRAARWLAGRHRPDEVRLHLVDPRRSLLGLADLPHVSAHAYDPVSLDQLVGQLVTGLRARRPPPGLPLRELASRRWWSGPAHVLVVDDQDVLPGSDPTGLGLTQGLAPLAELLPHAADLGWHILLARPVTGLARAAYDPFVTRLREYASATLVLSGDRTEGPVAGGVCAVSMPPGRGRLLLDSGGRAGGEIVQCALPAGGADG
jgi:S-DNA-T family DNA segregation ATPase FtsK/SpoIIIE